MKPLKAIRFTLYAMLLVCLAKAQNPKATYNREHPDKNKEVTYTDLTLAQDTLPPDTLIKLFSFGTLKEMRQYLKKKGFTYKHKPQYVYSGGRGRRGWRIDKPTFTSRFFKIYIYLYEGTSTVYVAYKSEYFRPAAMQAYTEKFVKAGFVKQDSTQNFSSGRAYYVRPTNADFLLLGPYYGTGSLIGLMHIPPDTVATFKLTAANLVSMVTCPKGNCIEGFIQERGYNEAYINGYSNADKVYHIDNYSYKLNITALDSSIAYLALSTTNGANYDTLLKGFTALGFVSNNNPKTASQLLNWEDVYQSPQYPGVALLMGARTYYTYSYQTHYYINLRRGKQ